MNKYQKERSREIRDIMRSDGFGRMTYKEAKRKWRKGIRAFRIGDMYAWKAADISHLGFTHKQLKEVGKAYHEIIKYCAKNSLAFTCQYEPYFDSYQLGFRGRSLDGKMYSQRHSVTATLLRQYTGSVVDIAEYVLHAVDHELQKSGFIVPADTEIQSMYPRMTLPPWCMLDPGYSIKSDGSIRINEISIIRKE